MENIPEALQYASPLGWAIIAGGAIFALAHARMSLGGAVGVAALAAFLAKTVLLDLT